MPRGMLQLQTRAPKKEHVYTTCRYDVKTRVVAHNRLRDGSLENATCQLSKNQRVEGKTSIVQSIQLGFSLSLGSATSNKANKSAMLRTEWTITARQAALRLAQMK